MKAITTIFESILRDNKDLVWSPQDEAAQVGICTASTWSWTGVEANSTWSWTG